MPTHIFLAPSDYESDLRTEIQYRRNIKLVKNDGPLFWVEGPKIELWWPQWQLWNVKREKIDSITQASKLLKSYGKYWLNLDFKLHRRSALIQDGLPKVKTPEVKRGALLNVPSAGAWFLEEANVICFTNEISIPFKNGIISVPQDKEAPSRAFQKLDEVFARVGRRPEKNEKVMDLGSHPGGWTWVLASLAGHVISVDTVALDPKAGKLKNVEFIKKDAFKLMPDEIGPIDWFFSDIICEPSRLLQLVNDWRKSNLVRNFICTIKFKGTVDFSVLAQFQNIPNSKIFHLNANKHELTWVCLS
jgi:23S rRNA (cytidine2498-2'-O)-methyltransferase